MFLYFLKINKSYFYTDSALEYTVKLNDIGLQPNEIISNFKKCFYINVILRKLYWVFVSVSAIGGPLTILEFSDPSRQPNRTVQGFMQADPRGTNKNTRFLEIIWGGHNNHKKQFLGVCLVDSLSSSMISNEYTNARCPLIVSWALTSKGPPGTAET